MQISADDIARVCSDSDVYSALLNLDDKRIVELGCGTAAHTRSIANTGRGRRITAFEVDRVQLEKNLATNSLGNVEFLFGGAQEIACDDASVDVVLMFKSLHHVPTTELGKAIREITRILRPGGHAYISEPVFAGAFNDIIRIFHDEQQVRRAAFEAIQRAVEQGDLELVDEIFFLAPTEFRDFSDFDHRIIRATHTEHRLDDKTYDQVRLLFNQHLDDSGAHFVAPMRVDLLRKPG